MIDGMVMANGHRVAGARVILYAWPSQKVTAAVRKGHRVPMSVVGSAVSSASGRYAVAISNWPALRRSADHGIVNLELEAFAGGHASTFSFSRKITGGGLAADNEARVPQMTPQRADLSMHAETPHSPGRPPCGDLVPSKDLGKRLTIVAVAYNAISHIVMKFHYGQNQSSSIGVGSSSSGGFGSWSESGTHSVSTDATQFFPRQTASKLYSTDFEYEKYLVECIGFQAQAKAWDGGDTVQKVGNPSPPAPHCVNQLKNGGMTVDSTSAYVFEGGATLASLLGINLSAHTGYSKTASLNYTFNEAGALCGTKGFPPAGSPNRLESRPTNS